MGMNLDEARAARREAKDEAPTIILGGQEFELPLELPLEIAERMAQVSEARDANDTTQVMAGVVGMVKTLLGEQYDDFMSHRPSMEDLQAMIEGLADVYGLNEGESEASES